MSANNCAPVVKIKFLRQVFNPVDFFSDGCWGCHWLFYSFLVKLY